MIENLSKVLGDIDKVIIALYALKDDISRILIDNGGIKDFADLKMRDIFPGRKNKLETRAINILRYDESYNITIVEFLNTRDPKKLLKYRNSGIKTIEYINNLIISITGYHWIHEG